jgi:hypothetical protein
MRRKILIVLGCCFLLMGFLLLTGYVLMQGVNDAEWEHIDKTGKISDSNLVVWSNWQQDQGLVIPQFPGTQYVLPEQGILEFRKGKASDMMFDFTVYECRKTSGSTTKIVPAIGPGWGASYHGIWSFLALSIGAALLLLGLLIRNSTSKFLKRIAPGSVIVL